MEQYGSISCSVQLPFVSNRKWTSAADTSQTLGWINHCCWMISFTSRSELKLLILFIYWNIKSLICHLSWPSFIILAATHPVGLRRFPSHFVWSNCRRLSLFLRLSLRVHLQLGSRLHLEVGAIRAFIYQMTQHLRSCHAQTAELIKKLAFENQFITLPRLVILLLFHFKFTLHLLS